MKLLQILCEIRSNYHLNPKTSINDKLTEINKNNTGNYFVSMTEIDKLGINPSSKYNTPLGIYSYPLQYVVDKIQNGSLNRLPFAGNQNFVNVFRVNGNIIDIGKFSIELYEEYITKLKQIIKSTGFSIVEHVFLDIINKSYAYASNKSIGGRFWYIMYELSKTIAENYVPKRKFSIVWNNLFRQLGIDGVVDNGLGIIHRAEPTQAVFFSMSKIVDIKRFNNTHIADTMKKNKDTGEDIHKSIIMLRNATKYSLNISQILSKYPEYLKYIKNNDVRKKALIDDKIIEIYIGNLNQFTDDELLYAFSHYFDSQKVQYITAKINYTNIQVEQLFNVIKKQDVAWNDSVYHVIQCVCDTYHRTKSTTYMPYDIIKIIGSYQPFFTIHSMISYKIPFAFDAMMVHCKDDLTEKEYEDLVNTYKKHRIHNNANT